jgi:hypothetical protein
MSESIAQENVQILPSITKTCNSCLRELTPAHFTGLVKTIEKCYKSCSICRLNASTYYHKHKAAILENIHQNAYTCDCGARVLYTNQCSHETESYKHRIYLQSVAGTLEDKDIMSIDDATAIRCERLDSIRVVRPNTEVKMVDCPCGNRIKRRGLLSHYKTRKHLLYEAEAKNVTDE